MNNHSPKKKTKAIGVISGGLDSILASTIMHNQEVELYLLHFIMPWKENASPSINELATNLKAKLIAHPLDDKYMEMLKNPKHGYGSAFNPCIDCHIFMFTHAKKYMDKYNADFVFTGEVLAQRPMSQMRDKLELIEQSCNLEGRLLRPLSAKILKPTIPENEGLIDRNALFSISGRGRKKQIQLAKDLKIENYPQPAGGCLLTDQNYGRKVKDLLKHHYSNYKDMILLQWGRHLRIDEKYKVILGRDAIENENIVKHSNPEDTVMSIFDDAGPTLLLQGENPNKNVINKCGEIIKCFSKSKKLDSVRIQFFKSSTPEDIQYFDTSPLDSESLKKLTI